VKLSKLYFHFYLISIIMQVLIFYSLPANADETRINNFRNLVVSHKRVGNIKSTVLKDANGQILVTFRTTKNGIDIFLPENNVRNYFPFSIPLKYFPSDDDLESLAIFIAGGVEQGKRGIIDEPGCNVVHDIRGGDPCNMVNCCYEHDVCYKEHGCRALSWIPTFMMPLHSLLNPCAHCNRQFLQCWLSREDIPESEIKCFDANCGESGESFVCPRDYSSEFCNCDCLSPCDITTITSVIP
jgi:hypothetical protein